MSKLYEIREGTDLKWGIYTTEYNLRIAEFYPNTEADRKQIQELIQNQPKYGVIDYVGADGHPYRDKVQKIEVTEEFIKEKVNGFLDDLPQDPDKAKKYLQDFIRSFIKECVA